MTVPSHTPCLGANIQPRPSKLTLFTLEGLFPEVARRALTDPFLSLLLRSRGVRLLGEGVLRAKELTVGSRSRTGLSFSTKVSRRGLGFTLRGPEPVPVPSRSCRAHCSSCAASLLASSRISSSFSGLRRPKLNLTPCGEGATAFGSLRWERPRRRGFSEVTNTAMSSSSRLRQKTNQALCHIEESRRLFKGDWAKPHNRARDTFPNPDAHVGCEIWPLGDEIPGSMRPIRPLALTDIGNYARMKMQQIHLPFFLTPCNLIPSSPFSPLPVVES